MTKAQNTRHSEPQKTGTSPVVDLIDDAQRTNDWDDDDFERALGVAGAGLMTLLRNRVVQLSYRAVVERDLHLKANVLEVLQALMRSNATDAVDAVSAIYSKLRVGDDAQRILYAYREAGADDNRVSALQLPHATVWVVPNTALKPEDDDTN